MRSLLLILFLIALTAPARAATDVWLFYGAGWHAWSSGIDQIARRVATLSGVGRVTVLDYRDTQRAYDEARQTPSSDQIVMLGYSCGGNSSLSVAGALAQNRRQVAVITLQPSRWCGQYPATANMVYLQNTWSADTGGLGDYQPAGPARRIIHIERTTPHLEADTDPMFQRDAVLAVAAIAQRSRQVWLAEHLRRTAHLVRSEGRAIWLEGN